MNIIEINHYLSFIKLLTDRSGNIIQNYFRQPVTIESKEDNSPVTIADKKAEEVIRELIAKEFPDHGILGEEFGRSNPNSDFCWIIDPIDGTKSFISGALTWGTLIGLTIKDQPVLGVFHQPILNELLIGNNENTLLNGMQVKLRQCNDISKATLLTTDYLHIKKYFNINNFDKLAEKVNLFRMWGDCYGYYLLSTGYADIMIDAVMSPWDSLPLIPIVQGAGGTITDYKGGSAVNGKGIVAASKEIHSEVISILNDQMKICL